MTLGQKIALTLGILVLSVLVIGIYTEKQLDRVRHQIRQANRAWDQLGPLVDLSTELRRFQQLVSEADPSAPDFERDRIDGINEHIGDLLADLAREIADSEEQLALTGLETHASLVESHARLSESADRVLAARDPAEREAERPRFMAMCSMLGAWLSLNIGSAQTQMATAMEEAGEIENEIDAVMVTWMIGFSALVIYLWIALRRVLLAPIRALARGVTALGAKRFEHRVPVRSGDELGLVGQRFNEMAEELESFYHHLEERVAQQTEQVRRTYAELERSNKLAGIGTLAAGVAHEINNPMEAITLCVDGLQRHVERGEAPAAAEMRENLDMIREDLSRCRSIISQLRDFSRQKPPGPLRDPEIIDLAPILRGAVNLIPRSRQDGERHVVCGALRDDLLISGDPHQVRQVFLNLILNAHEATEPGGEIRISARRVGDQVHVAISDDGSGIDHQDLPHLFEPFYTTKAEGTNSGLGLSVVHGIVTGHGGSIAAESQGPGRGATFLLTFPHAGSEE